MKELFKETLMRFKGKEDWAIQEPITCRVTEIMVSRRVHTISAFYNGCPQ
jgi:hypothetical protein